MLHTRFTALLVDDESAANQRLTQLLAEHPMLQVIGSMQSVSMAKAFLQREGVQVPDLIFLDVEMPGGTGMQLLPCIPKTTQVIFVTAHEEYAAQAFEFGVLDYLVKPVAPGRLEKTVERFLKQHGSVVEKATPSDQETLIPAPVVRNKEMHVVPLESIRWIEGMQNYSRVMMRGVGTAAVFRRSLAEWGSLLSEEGFYRIGRSHIIRLSALQKTKWVSRDETELFFEGIPEPLVIGRSAAARLKELL